MGKVASTGGQLCIPGGIWLSGYLGRHGAFLKFVGKWPMARASRDAAQAPTDVAANRLLIARSYAFALLELAKSDDWKGSLSRVTAPFYLLASLAFELSLKAAVLSAGGTVEEAEALSHDLNRSFRRAVEKGYRPPSHFVELLVASLAPYHRQHDLRYLPVSLEAMKLPLPAFTLTVLGQHLDAVQHQYGIDA